MIDIPNRRIQLVSSKTDLVGRRAETEAKGDLAWKPVNCERYVSAALQAYALLTTSADTGTVRDLSQIRR